MSKQSIIRKNVLSLLDHTPEWLSYHTKRQARRRRHPRDGGRPHHGLRHLHRKYVKSDGRACKVIGKSEEWKSNEDFRFGENLPNLFTFHYYLFTQKKAISRH